MLSLVMKIRCIMIMWWWNGLVVVAVIVVRKAVRLMPSLVTRILSMRVGPKGIIVLSENAVNAIVHSAEGTSMCNTGFFQKLFQLVAGKVYKVFPSVPTKPMTLWEVGKESIELYLFRQDKI